jgi:hypothetical protein
MKKIAVIASVAVSLLLLLSIGASYTGLFYFDWNGHREGKYSEWNMIGRVEVKNGSWSTVP